MQGIIRGPLLASVVPGGMIRMNTSLRWLCAFALTFSEIAGASPFAIEPPLGPAVRALHVEQVGVEAAQEPDGYPALVVAAPVRALGLAGQPVSFEARVYTSDGRLVGTAAASDTVAFPSSVWNPLRLAVAGRGLNLRPEERTRVVVSVTARCAGLTSVSHCESTFPFVAETRPPRGVRLLAVATDPARVYVPTGFNTQAAPGSGFVTVPLLTGIRVRCSVAAEGLRGQTLKLTLRLRRLDGRPVAAAPRFRPSVADQGGLFVAQARDPILFDSASWSEFSAAIPGSALDLEAGLTHRVILTTRVDAGPFSAWAEQDLDVDVTAPEPGPTVSIPPPPATSPSGEALLEAILRGDEAGARAALEARGPVDARDARGRTALHLAAAYGLTDLASRLLDRGALLEATDAGGSTPLHLAALQDREATVRLLIQRGAQVTARDRSGRRPLELAGSEGTREVLRRALEKFEADIAVPARRCVEAVLVALRAGDRRALDGLVPGAALERLPETIPSRPFTFETRSIEPAPGGARAIVRLRFPGTTPRGIELGVAFWLSCAQDRWTVTGAEQEVAR